jgi:hypothetical protein
VVARFPEVRPVKRFEQGLRCQDIHAGLRAVDPNSPALGRLDDTRMVGMAASLAAMIRGQDVIRDAQTLKLVAADQLDVDSLAFPAVIEILDAAGFVHTVERKGGKIVSFVEGIPFHEDLYETLGEVWTDRSPTEIEQEMVATVHRLAAGPVPAEELADELGLNSRDVPDLLGLAREADLVKGVTTVDGEVLYSPFMGFEHPEVMGEVLQAHGPDQFQEEVARLRAYQGLPVEPGTFPALMDAVARGLIAAPSVERPDHVAQPFATLPYTPDPSLFSVRKPILDKALVVLACVRCGQHFGGATAITTPLAILDALLDPARGHKLRPHSSHRRQYQLLFRRQIVDFIPSGSWVIPRLIDTEDNVAAVKLARDLIAYGEPLQNRTGSDEEARRLLMTEAGYLTPIQTVHQRRKELRLTPKQYEKAMDALMGRSAL